MGWDGLGWAGSDVLGNLPLSARAMVGQWGGEAVRRRRERGGRRGRGSRHLLQHKVAREGRQVDEVGDAVGVADDALVNLPQQVLQVALLLGARVGRVDGGEGRVAARHRHDVAVRLRPVDSQDEVVTTSVVEADAVPSRRHALRGRVQSERLPLEDKVDRPCARRPRRAEATVDLEAQAVSQRGGVDEAQPEHPLVVSRHPEQLGRRGIAPDPQPTGRSLDRLDEQRDGKLCDARHAPVLSLPIPPTEVCPLSVSGRRFESCRADGAWAAARSCGRAS